MSSSVSPSHNVFVYGSFQEPAVVGLMHSRHRIRSTPRLSQV
ncbi:unnamed protein product [Brassica oleracea]